ncbi:unnamed protein product [Allacma fusca]|uniref:Carboxylesterase type B domain-containing protein n=1 Tax=Allacma fusca TaxID=39272 RepID=A0A8J2LH23_9HEXA|nr:unnamed protein product [Allacma fusca]
MVLITGGLFLFNLLCAIAPCDPKLDLPEVRVRKSFQEDQLDQSPRVITTNGGLEGYIMYSTEARPIRAFEGIPYGEPPLAQLRFRSPVRKAPWLGMKLAKKLRPECLQLSPAKLLRVVGNEDCLYLNVYTRQLPHFTLSERKLVPVIFWIHGGSYYFGNGGDYGPAYLLNHDVVLVTFNYRVGVLGFMSTGDSASPGNYGLKDQSLALKWVSENIKYFVVQPSHTGHINLLSKPSD